MALNRRVGVFALFVLGGCVSEDEATAALRGYCINNAASMACDRLLHCPCADEFSSEFICREGFCRYLDGVTCLNGERRLPGNAMCSCAEDCISRVCDSATHQCK